MVSLISSNGGYAKYAGLSTDTKPTEGVATGSEFTEVDTAKVYMFNADSSEWVEEYTMGGSGGGGGGESPVIFIRPVPGGEYDDDNNIIIPVDKTISEIMAGLDMESFGFAKVFFVELPYAIFQDTPSYREDGGKVVLIDMIEKLQGSEIVGEIGNTEYRIRITESGMFIVASDTT